MKPGKLVRKLLGSHFPIVGRWYRKLSVDLAKVAECVPQLPSESKILEIGAGDGELMNYILPRDPTLSATLIDIGADVGGWIDPELLNRVEIFNSTSVADYSRLGRPRPDVILLSDVVHHVPKGVRGEFLGASIKALAEGASFTLILKDVEPGSLRAKWMYLADHLITGDPNVEFMTRTEMRNLVEGVFDVLDCKETDLFRLDQPNYCFLFRVGATTA